MVHNFTQDNKVEGLTQERVAEGLEGLSAALTQIYVDRNQPDAVTAPYQFIIYKQGNQNALLMVDTKSTPYQVWYTDYEYGRTANYKIRDHVKDFLWENFGAALEMSKDDVFNKQFKDLANGINGGEIRKKAEESFYTNSAIQGKAPSTLEAAKSQLILAATTQSNVTTSKATFFSTSPVARRQEKEKAELEKSLKSQAVEGPDRDETPKPSF